MALVTCADGNTTKCQQDTVALLTELRGQMETLVPISTTTLTEIHDGTVIGSAAHSEAGEWLTGVFMAFVFIMGWRAAE